VIRFGIQESKIDFSRYLVRLEVGESNMPCRRNQSIAEIRPFRPLPARAGKQVVQRLVPGVQGGSHPLEQGDERRRRILVRLAPRIVPLAREVDPLKRADAKSLQMKLAVARRQGEARRLRWPPLGPRRAGGRCVLVRWELQSGHFGLG
jgi:antitoxin (DNA-binding transcriptional repressor) of toxin-antitoxin stability system